LEIFNSSDVRNVFTGLAGIMAANRDYLIQLDAATGDGDLGLTMSQGFAKINEVIRNSAEADVGKLIAQAGMIMAQAVPSTMGTLMASGMMRGGKALSGKTEIDLAGFTALLRAFEGGVMARGKAKPGERTVLDSIHPALTALDQAGDSSLAEGLQRAFEAAEAGVEETKTMEPIHGRSVYHKQNATGAPDQGAVVGMLFIKGFCDYANRQ
jgi:dihydroxyacetone kinase-like protein